MKPASTLTQHHEVGAGEPHKPQEDLNTLIVDIKTEPDLLDIRSFVYGDEHQALPTSENMWGPEPEQENEYTVVQCDDGRGSLTIIKQEPPEDEQSFCHELQLNCKTESIEISRDEEECDALLGQREEVNLTGTLDQFKNY